MKLPDLSKCSSFSEILDLHQKFTHEVEALDDKFVEEQERILVVSDSIPGFEKEILANLESDVEAKVNFLYESCGALQKKVDGAKREQTQYLKKSATFLRWLKISQKALASERKGIVNATELSEELDDLLANLHGQFDEYDALLKSGEELSS
jgi:hypothetical protein